MSVSIPLGTFLGMGAYPAIASLGGLSRRDFTRVMVFIDGANLYHSLEKVCGRTDLDYRKLCLALSDGRNLRRTYYYNARLGQSHDPDRYAIQQRFFDYLRRVPKLEVKLGNLVYSPDSRPRQKGVDVSLATDMLMHAFRDHYDTAVLVSGDADFADAVQAVKDLGPNVEIALFGPGSARVLRDVADEVINLTPEYFENLWREEQAGE